MIKSCRGCPHRFVGCHSVCPVGIAQEAEMFARADERAHSYYRRSARDIDRDVQSRKQYNRYKGIKKVKA